jgi:Mn2+/Fe2+ NRAMP family transporter
MKRKLLNYLFWLVIAAAFIGPGTVTTAASAGASFRYQLVWTMLFSTGACLILQESAARIVIATGKSLGQNIKLYFKTDGVAWLIASAIFLGCLAYEAGNILGALSGISLILTEVPSWLFIVIIGCGAFVVLYSGKSSKVANILGVLVGIMGIAFLLAVLTSEVNYSALVKGAFIPSLPKGSTMITLGLLGTTIVPYNIFLGSSLAEGQTLSEMRSGLSLSVVLGGLISVCVILVGAQLNESFSFSALYELLLNKNGQVMAWLFAAGLFAAGFTSTITASMAASLTIKSVYSKGKEWTETSTSYRLVWASVIMIGMIVGLSGVKPVPVILLAQAANGLILPLLTYVIWIIVNQDLMKQAKNNGLTNVLMALTLVATCFLGLLNVLKASYSIIGIDFLFQNWHLFVLLFLTSMILVKALLTMKTNSSS